MVPTLVDHHIYCRIAWARFVDDALRTPLHAVD